MGQSFDFSLTSEQSRRVSSARVGVINIDAHFDVRPLLDGKEPHSGSPFRQLLEDERFDGRNFVEFAAQGNQCSAEHVSYLHSKHANIVWMSQLRQVMR